MSAPERDASPGPLCVGQRFRENYEVTGLIGAGGHAWVYRARHRFMGHEVAIKVLRQDGKLDPDNFRRGLAEAQIQHKLNHPGIVPVMDAGVSETGLLYIVMELQRGRSLRTLLEEHGKLTVDEVLRTAGQVAEALQAAHEAKIIHRDVKPENVIIGHGNHVKVIDFGVAKVLDNAGWVTQKNMVLGTIYYMSPEQLQARFITAQSDIYALGILMIEALLGQHPVLLQLGARERTLYELTRVIVSEDFPMLDELDARIPRYVAALVYKATVKVASKRFASMQEFARAIRECLNLYERDAREQGIDLSSRELWRHKVTSSGVESIQRSAERRPNAPSPSPSPSSSSSPPHDTRFSDDTHPQSRPLFFGAISSGLLTQNRDELDAKPAARLRSIDTATVPLGSIIAEAADDETQNRNPPTSARSAPPPATLHPGTVIPTEVLVDEKYLAFAEATTGSALIQPAPAAHASVPSHASQGSEQPSAPKPAGHDFKTLARVVAIGALLGSVIAVIVTRFAPSSTQSAAPPSAKSAPRAAAPSSAAFPSHSSAPNADVVAVAIDAAVAEHALPPMPSASSVSSAFSAASAPASASATQRAAPRADLSPPRSAPPTAKPAVASNAVAPSAVAPRPVAPKNSASSASKAKPKASAKPAPSDESDQSWIRVRL
jgi:serine/threonine protein kinase